ncbi:MAG: SLC13 family permease [Myxococcota bacterium]|nr:SLC13 family permease [Myxococcota bacterium]MDW8364009.1 SLC13 family permease [Myxococcales bacterium]
MDWQAWTTLAVVVAMVVALARNVASPDVVLTAGLTLLVTAGLVPLERAFAGFANEGLLSVGALFVVAAGVRATGGLDLLLRRVLGRPRGSRGALLRMMLPVSAVSAFVNNTPLVAMMVPVVLDWSRRCRIAASHLLLPLSYASILGGTCTLVGTSTNLVVYGLARRREPELDLGMFDIAVLGLPTLLVGIAYVVLAAPRLLRDRAGPEASVTRPREYTVAMRVEPDAAVVGQSIEEAGLRHLPGLYLVEIERDGEVLAAVGPETRLRGGDVLLFVGVVDSVVDLRRIRGLVPATDQVDKLAVPRPSRRLLEAVVGQGSELTGRSVRDLQFRTRYGAAIIAVHRDGERVGGKVGDIVLRAGDVLLLEAPPGFLPRWRNDRAFALITEVEGGAPPRHERGWLALAILAAMVALSALGILPLLVAALLAVAAMLATGCLGRQEAWRAVDLPILVTIGSAFGVGAALEHTGAAAALGRALVELAAPLGPVATLAAIYLATTLLTELISNNAAAALMFPLAAEAGQAAGIGLVPVSLVIMMAASASFSTPIGYQTNLMVYGPGGYRFSDFLRVGIPLQLLLAVVAVGVAAAIWL